MSHSSAGPLPQLRVGSVDIIARTRPQLRDEHDSNAVQVDEKAGTVAIKVPLVGSRKAKLKRFVVDAAIAPRYALVSQQARAISNGGSDVQLNTSTDL